MPVSGYASGFVGGSGDECFVEGESGVRSQELGVLLASGERLESIAQLSLWACRLSSQKTGFCPLLVAADGCLGGASEFQLDAAGIA